MCAGNPHHKHALISEIHAVRDQEILFDKPFLKSVEDDENVTLARKNHKENPTFQTLMELGNALAFQMRYNEAISCFEDAIKINPDDYQARRKCAGRYLSTLRLDKAEEGFLWCDARAEDKLDTKYMLGCCAYYKYEYKKAMGYFDECFALSEDDDDMYVAVLFWAIACAVQLGQDVKNVLKKYKDLHIGHHTGYMQAVRLFMGDDIETCDNIPYDDELQRCIFSYGVHLYYLYNADEMRADVALQSTLSRDTYFSAFAYLGAYTEYLKLNPNP